MAICRFFQQGYCKFGNNCRFEHPSSGSNRPQQSNRFGAAAPSSSGAADAQLQAALAKYSLSTETIVKDLTTEAPQWILSCYAPGREAPELLFGGYPREQSFEEMRLRHYAAKAAGVEHQALSEAQELYQNCQQQMQNAVRNVDEAARFVVEAENKHPNRTDICREASRGAPFGRFAKGRTSLTVALSSQQVNPFSTASNTGSMTTTAAANPLSAAAPTAATPSAFGQPAVLGQQLNPFAAPSFGQPAVLGQQPNPFAAPSSGQPAILGQQPSPFAAPSFGQPAVMGQQPNPFAAPSSGQPAVMGQQPSPFAAPSVGQPAVMGQRPNPFATPSSGQPAQPAQSSSGFSQQPQPSSAFGQLSQQQPPPDQTSLSGGGPAPFGQHAKNMDGTLASFKGKAVIYKENMPGTRGFDGTWTRVWFPDGAPGYCRDNELPAEQYDDLSRSQWAAFAQTGTFADGLLPELPPPREYIQWNL